MKKNVWLTLLVSFLGVLLVVIAWYRGRGTQGHVIYEIRGKTMGGTYAVVAHGYLSQPQYKIHEAIEARLAEINSSMSTWDKDSEISRLNRLPEGIEVEISDDFYRVLFAAMELSRSSDGAYDITIGPLVNLWGYGPDDEQKTPNGVAVLEAKKKVGFRQLQLGDHRIKKIIPDMYLDVSSKAPGFAAEELGKVLEKFGVKNYLVEVGGEIQARGNNPEGAAWSVGIEKPVDGPGFSGKLVDVVYIHNGALATSGAYHRFRKVDKKRIHHIIDPRTGVPSQNDLISATVITESCTQADGMSTTLMVLGEKEGMEWAKKNGIEALLITQDAKGELHQTMTPGFGEFLRK